MKKLVPIIILLLALVVAWPAAAQASATVTMTPDRDTVTVGDPVNFTVAVTHPAGTQVLWPELDANWGDFIVQAQSPVETIDNGDGTATTTQVIDARLFTPGAYQTPPLNISIADSAGQISEIQAAPVGLTVQSVLVAGDTTLRDIKPQASLPFPANWPWALASMGALAAIAVWLIFRRVKAVIDNRLPHEVALDVLAEVEKQKLAENGRFKTHYSLITDALRTYVEQTQGIQATDRTTSELKTELKQTTLTTTQAQQFIDLLQTGDLVKFARFTPTLADAQAIIAEARQFIEATKPELQPDAGKGNDQRHHRVTLSPGHLVTKKEATP